MLTAYGNLPCMQHFRRLYTNVYCVRINMKGRASPTACWAEVEHMSMYQDRLNRNEDSQPLDQSKFTNVFCKTKPMSCSLKLWPGLCLKFLSKPIARNHFRESQAETAAPHRKRCLWPHRTLWPHKDRARARRQRRLTLDLQRRCPGNRSCPAPASASAVRGLGDLRRDAAYRGRDNAQAAIPRGLTQGSSAKARWA